MSTFNPFRANPLSPTSTGASVNTVTSYNPPPSFHSVARDDEMTVFFDVDELPVISEEADGEGSELSRTGTVMSTGTVREESGTRTPTLIDLEHSLPPTPKIRIQVEEPALPPLPLSPRSTGSGTRNGAGDDNVDFPVPEYLDDLPPAYSPAPDSNHGEATLELGPRRPFQQPPRTPHQSAPTLAAQGNNSFPPLASPSPGPFTPRQTPPFSSLNRGRRGFEQVSNPSGVGNLRSGASTGAPSATVTNSRPSQGQAQQILRHARLFSGTGGTTGGGGRLSPFQPGASSAIVTNSRPSQRQAQILRHARLFSDVGSRTGGTTGGGGRLSPFQSPLPPRLSPNATGGSPHSANSVNTRSSAPAETTAGNCNTNSSQTGRLCWQCGGAGRVLVSYLFSDNSVCMECSGIGRVYR